MTKPNTDLVLVEPARGRPSDFDEALTKAICARVADGENLSAICREEGMPDRGTVYNWMREHQDFFNDYARSRSIQADLHAEQIVEIADNKEIEPDHKRVMIDARKWRAARQNWRAWGDKVQHEHAHTIHTPNDAGQLPAGLDWIAGKLPGCEAGARPESDDSGVGEE